jgi:hypothetical protein
MSSEGGAYEITLDGSEALVSDGVVSSDEVPWASFLFCARLLLASSFSFAGTLVICCLTGLGNELLHAVRRLRVRRMAAFSTDIAEVGLACGAWGGWIAVSKLVIAFFSICNCGDVFTMAATPPTTGHVTRGVSSE